MGCNKLHNLVKNFPVFLRGFFNFSEFLHRFIMAGITTIQLLSLRFFCKKKQKEKIDIISERFDDELKANSFSAHVCSELLPVC